MKIGIVTLPFNSNYGGLLQAYALQSVLKQMGNEVLTVNQYSKSMPLRMKILSFGRRSILRLIFRKQIVVRTWPNGQEESIISQHTNRFIEENIITTQLIRSKKDFDLLYKYNFDAYIVGSDQVWRPKYSPCLENHFLGFLKNNSKIKRIAYAASFGVDNWEYSPSQTKTCSSLVKQFNSVSVREDSAINLCKKYLGIDAVQNLDPTLLISKEEYINLVVNDNIPKHSGTLLVYILDLSAEKKNIIKQVTELLKLTPISTMPEGLFREVGSKNLKHCIYPPVTYWLRGFMDSEFVITDSFHGTVFSIIFNKPFLAIGNTKRGITRFISLLKMFGLEDRLIQPGNNDITKKINTKINYSTINVILEKRKIEALSFLQNALNPSD